MYADAVLCAVLQAESMDTPSYVPTSASSMKVDKMHFKVILIRYHSRFFDCLAHPNPSATLATAQRWDLSVSSPVDLLLP